MTAQRSWNEFAGRAVRRLHSEPRSMSEVAIFYCSLTFSGLQIGQRWKRWISRFHHGQFCLSDSCLQISRGDVLFFVDDAHHVLRTPRETVVAAIYVICVVWQQTYRAAR